MATWTMARSVAKIVRSREQSPELADWLADIAASRGNAPGAIRKLSHTGPEVAQVLVARQREGMNR